jgi:hypothetical protein
MRKVVVQVTKGDIVVYLHAKARMLSGAGMSIRNEAHACLQDREREGAPFN